MNNYELHERAQLLADTHSAYELARMVLVAKYGEDSPNVPAPASTTACDDQLAPDPNGVDT